MKKSISFFAALLACLLSAGALMAAPVSEYISLYEDLPFDMPVIDKPSFPSLSVEITEFGGIADGRTLNTEAFEKAMSYLSSKGGGSLNVPTGVWLTGPITFRSNINLHLDRGAIILFSPDASLYPVVKTSYEGFEHYRSTSPLNGENLENIAITGEGVIDGNGAAWRQVRHGQMNAWQWKRKVASGGIVKDDRWYPDQSYLDGESISDRLKDLTMEEAIKIRRYLRPVMLKFISCRNVYLQGVLFQNSPAWNLHPLMCENLIIDQVYVKNPDYAQNGDGLDVESCRNVIIYRTTLDVGDDAICIKSGKDEEGRLRGMPTENVIVRDCRVFRGHGGFVVGSEMSGGVRNISVRDCQFIGTDVGLRFKSTRGRGGVVENIYIDHVHMLDIYNEALLFDLFYWVKTPLSYVPPVDETTPQFRNISISDVRSFHSGMSVKFNGLPEMNISNIRLSDCDFTARDGGLLSESTDVVFDRVSISAQNGPALTISNVTDAEFINCEFSTPFTEKILCKGECKGVEMKE